MGRVDRFEWRPPGAWGSGRGGGATSSIVMARFMRPIHAVYGVALVSRGLWMARTSRAMTYGFERGGDDARSFCRFLSLSHGRRWEEGPHGARLSRCLLHGEGYISRWVDCVYRCRGNTSFAG